MKPMGLLLCLAFALSLTLQACGGSTPPSATADDEPERLSTAVAGTLTAAAPLPTDTAVPTVTSTPTPEPTRQPGPLRVVYSRAGSIWIWTEGGKPKQLTNNIVDAKPRLSDDGQLVVFERNNELYAVNSDGSNLHVLVSNQFLKDYLPSGYKFIWAEYYDWMPNSHYVYFTTKTGISGSYTDIFQYDLFRADLDSGEVKLIVTPGSGGVPYFGADKKTIAMVQGQAIYLANADGTNVRKALSFEPIYTWSEWIFLPVAVPLPDGSGFRVVISTHGPPDGQGKPPEFWNIPVVGDAKVLYSLHDAVDIFKNYVGFRFLSPNGETFAYLNAEPSDSSQICLHKNVSSSDDCMTQQGINGTFIKWAPDSVHFVTFDYDENNTENYYLTDGLGNSTKLTTSSLMYWIDMNRYIFVDRDYNLYLGSINGNPMKIDKGIVQKVGKVDIWTWQFDFSY